MELAEQKDQVAPQIVVPDGEVFAVQMGSAYFFDFDEDGFPRTHHFPHCVTKEEAEETRNTFLAKYHAYEIGAQCRHGDARGLEVSPGSLLQNELVQR